MAEDDDSDRDLVRWSRFGRGARSNVDEVLLDSVLLVNRTLWNLVEGLVQASATLYE